MTLSKALLSDLQAELSSDLFLFDEDVRSRMAGIWRDDTIQASVLLRPKTTEETSTALRICHAHGQSVVTHGGLTGLVEGAITQPHDLVLSTERMNQIEEVSPLERTITAQAGVVLQTLQETAANAGLMFPLDLGGRGSCTVGGNISTNAGGNRVIRYGMMRDMVLGLEAVLADGTVISAMNHMIKNNAGYDLKQWFIGTEGTLGVVTRAVLRCREALNEAPTLLVGLQDFDQLSKFLKHADRSLRGHLSAFEVMWQNYYQLVTDDTAGNAAPLSRDYPLYVLVEALGAEEQTALDLLESALNEQLIEDAVIAQSEAQRQSLWALRDDVAQTFRHGPVFLFDVSLRLPDMATYVDDVNRGLKARFGEFHNYTLGHVGDGNLHFAIAVGDGGESARQAVEEAVYSPLQPIGGSVSAEHGIGLEKKPYLHLARSESEIALMRQMKLALDPKGILNPGKVV